MSKLGEAASDHENVSGHLMSKLCVAAFGHWNAITNNLGTRYGIPLQNNNLVLI